MTPLRKLVEQASGYAEAMFDPDDDMLPHFVAEDAQGKITIVTMAVAGPVLDRARRDMALRFKLDRFRRWVFFAQAWMAEMEAGGRIVDPVDHPERVEVVQFQGLDLLTGRAFSASRQILRTADYCRLMPLVEDRADRCFDRPAVVMSEGASAGATR